MAVLHILLCLAMQLTTVTFDTVSTPMLNFLLILTGKYLSIDYNNCAR